MDLGKDSNIQGSEGGNNDRQQTANDANNMAVNPNPRANENIDTSGVSNESSDAADQVGSEITDGEDG